MSQQEAKIDFGFGPKPTRLQREARLVLVEEAMYGGDRLLTSAVIERDFARSFGVRARAIRGYMKRVRERVKLRAEKYPDPRINRDRITDILTARMNRAIELGETAAAAGNIPAALRAEGVAIKAIMAIGEFHGLRIQRHEISGPGGAPLTTTPAEAARQLQEAMERVVKRSTASAGDVPPASDAK